MMSSKQINHFREVALAVAMACGNKIENQLLQPHQIEKKDRFDLVTETDKLLNNLIKEYIHLIFRNHDMLAEEDNHAEAMKKKNGNQAEVTWIIDPIDGTTNFAKGVPHAALSVAAWDNIENCLIAGVVYDPFRKEFFSAGRGLGAFLNEKPIRVTETKKMEDALIATGIYYKDSMGQDDNIAEVSTIMRNCLGIRRNGAASLDLAWVAMGRFDAYWEKDLHPWDIAAGMLLVTEAKGQLSTYSGKPLDPFLGQIVASNSFLHQEFLDHLQKARRDANLPIEPQ